MSCSIKIGSRKSKLAICQAEYVRKKLLSHHPSYQIEIVHILSEGDQTLDISLSKVGGKGLFVKELELALLRKEIDLAVHSMKDVNIVFPEGLHIPAFCPREDPRDAFVSNQYSSLENLPSGAVVGTYSLRRQIQIKSVFPHLNLTSLRGNINTRLDRLDQGEYDAIILATAGLKRLGLNDRIKQKIDMSICLPAVGQGIIGIECRVEDEEINNLIQSVNDTKSEIAIRAERGANQSLGGGCHVPVAVYAELINRDKVLHIQGMVGEIDGSRILRAECQGSSAEALNLGKQIADNLIEMGADRIL